MSVVPIKSQSSSRGARMLRTALGPEIAAWLEDAAVIEVMLNPDGRLWIDRLGAGIADTGSHMSAADGERIIRLVAHHVGAEVHAGNPRVSAELPDTATCPLSPKPKEIDPMFQTLSRGRTRLSTGLLGGFVALTVASPAHAAGSSMPWEAPLQSILESIQGPVAKIVAVMIIIATGLALAFGDTSGGARRMVQIVFGLSIAFAASSFFLSFFSFGGGALV